MHPGSAKRAVFSSGSEANRFWGDDREYCVAYVSLKAALSQQPTHSDSANNADFGQGPIDCAPEGSNNLKPVNPQKMLRFVLPNFIRWGVAVVICATC
jgi:hypothetical protein